MSSPNDKSGKSGPPKPAPRSAALPSKSAAAPAPAGHPPAASGGAPAVAPNQHVTETAGAAINEAAHAASTAGNALLEMLEQLLDKATKDSGITLSIAGALLALVGLNMYKWYN